jgi:type VI secretion system protein ImpK
MNMDDKTVVQFRNADGVTQASKPIAGGFARPNPGGRRAKPGPAPEPIPQVSVPAFVEPRASEQVCSSSANPLLSAAQPLLEKIAQLALQSEDYDVIMFREGCCQQLQRLEQQWLHSDINEESRHYACYVLCTVLDELVSKTHWGRGRWSEQSLLSQFHGETGGGERFFQLLDYLQQAPAKNLNLLELMYVCLGLGFEGKYRLDSRGHAQLEELRDNLFYLLRAQKGEPERDLSSHWQSLVQRRNPLSHYLPLWVVAVLVSIILLASYSGFAYLLNDRTQALLLNLSAPIQQDVRT